MITLPAMSSSALRQRRIQLAAEPYGGVLSRDLLRGFGVDRNVVARMVTAERWRLHGRETVAMHTGPLSPLAQRWRAVWEIGAAYAALDGVGSMHAAGLVGYDERLIHISVPWSVTDRAAEGVCVHRLHRGSNEIVGPGPPRVRTAVAAVRAAQWAGSDRQAALLLALPVQQRLIHASHLVDALAQDRVRGRKRFVRQIVQDIADGAQSLGELDFAGMCRTRGLPEPDRQFVVHTDVGRLYLDVRWVNIGLVVEIDGSGHREGLALVEDNFRQNLISMTEDVVLRYDLLALRVQESAVMDQVCLAHQVLARRRVA
jgi:very-short-patch-repair endonuclease